ncbi:MAG: hypothetical protein QOJ59_1292 [Thermomicrobiales bacterium]|jgi:hypothetical protein|nr:hypothetical protein [Thermomicrobiales bacterium]
MLIGSHRYLLVAPHSHEVVGFQIEDFLDQMVQAYPYLIFVLKVAQLRGITTDEVTKLSRRMLPSRFRLGYQIRMMFGGATSTKRTFAGQFADAGPWAIPPTVAWL